MQIRKPAVAGQFYPAERDECLSKIKSCFDSQHSSQMLPARIIAGIVPHAGWVFSGNLACQVFSSIKKQNNDIDTFIILGAAHRYVGSYAAIYSKGSWQMPLGDVLIDEDLAGAILKVDDFVKADELSHFMEHSIEVQVPFVQHFFPEAEIVPIIVPRSSRSISLGASLAKVVKSYPDKKIAVIGSTDLTHYGPGYHFTPMGTGDSGLDWARDVNDEVFISHALQLEPLELLEDALSRSNACGPGSAAATVSFAKEMGVKNGTMIAHSHSNDIMQKKFHQKSSDSVGYVSIVF